MKTLNPLRGLVWELTAQQMWDGSLTPRQIEQVQAWTLRHGMKPEDVAGIRISPSTMTARFSCYQRDEDGRLTLDPEAGAPHHYEVEVALQGGREQWMNQMTRWVPNPYPTSELEEKAQAHELGPRAEIYSGGKLIDVYEEPV